MDIKLINLVDAKIRNYFLSETLSAQKEHKLRLKNIIIFYSSGKHGQRVPRFQWIT